MENRWGRKIRMTVVDMHCDTISGLYEQRKRGKNAAAGSGDLLRNRLHVDLEKLKKGGYLLQNFALFVNLSDCGNPLEECLKMADLYEEELKKYEDRIRPAYCYEDIERNRREGKISALLTVEEGGVCRGNTAFLRILYRLGVRMMTLTWNFPNELAWPNISMPVEGEEKVGDVDFKKPEKERGLTETGAAFLREMERLGMIVDVSHLSDAGFWDVVRLAERPFVASHSNARAVCPHVRNLDDEMIRALAEHGGVMGLNFCPAFLEEEAEGRRENGTIAAVVAHAKHIVRVGGEDCLGLGSDFDGIPTHMELSDASRMPLLTDALKREGFTETQVEKIFSGNVLRLYREIL